MNKDKMMAKSNDIESFHVFLDNEEIKITSFEMISKTIEDFSSFKTPHIKKYRTYHTVVIKTK